MRGRVEIPTPTRRGTFQRPWREAKEQEALMAPNIPSAKQKYCYTRAETPPQNKTSNIK